GANDRRAKAPKNESTKALARAGRATLVEQGNEDVVSLLGSLLVTFEVLGDGQAVQHRQDQRRQRLAPLGITVGEAEALNDVFVDQLVGVAVQSRRATLEFWIATCSTPHLDVQAGAGLVVLDRVPERLKCRADAIRRGVV